MLIPKLILMLSKIRSFVSKSRRTARSAV